MARNRGNGGYIERERYEDFLDKKFCSVAAGVAAAGLAGAAMSSSAASSAADKQSQAAQNATAAQMMAAAQTRQDLSPWVSSGSAAQSKLNQYLGIGGVGSSGVTSSGLATGLTPDQVRQQLLSQYTKNTTSPASPGYNGTPNFSGSPLDQYQSLINGAQPPTASTPGVGPGYWASNGLGYDQVNGNPNTQWVSGSGPQSTSTVDEDGLNAAIAKYYQENGAQNSAAQSDPTYGSLLTPFHNGAEFDPGPAFSFTGDDLQNSPGYQFGLTQGTQGINNGQAARGNFLSGAAMKELDKYNQDYAGTKFNDAFNQAQSTYNTNLSAQQNAWNTNLNAYDNNRSKVYSFLTGVSGLGQASAAGVASSNQQAANGAASNALAAGNAQSAAGIASGNALQSGINSAVNGYNSTQQTAAWNNMLAGNSDYGINGQSNPANQAALQAKINTFTG